MFAARVAQIVKAGEKSAIAFDEKQHSKLLVNGGTFVFRVEPSCIYLESLQSKSQGNGFGTAVFRYLMDVSFKEGRYGNIILNAQGSSHLFYLFMGMNPKEWLMDYLPHKYGRAGSVAVAKIANTINGVDLTPKEVTALIDIFSKEKSMPVSEISLETLVQNKEFFKALNSKRCSYLQFEFIPNLVACLQSAIDMGEEYLDTESLCVTEFVMSNQAKQRWKAELDAKQPMVLFKRLEHLAKYITVEQQKVIDAYIAKYRKAFVVVPRSRFGVHSVAYAMPLLDRGAKLRSGPDRMLWKCLQPVKTDTNTDNSNDDIKNMGAKCPS